MGNELLSDDAVGLLVVQELEKSTNIPNVEFKCAQIAGFKLVDILTGYDRVIVVDAIMTGRARPGEFFWLDLSELRRPIRNKSNHNIHLADAFELGTKLGYHMPEEVKVLAIEVEDCFTLSEQVGDTAMKAVPKAVEMIIAELDNNPKL